MLALPLPHSAIAPFGTVVALLCLAVVIYGFNIPRRWALRKIPGPPAQWLLGNLVEFTALKQHGALLKWTQQYGSVFKLLLGRFGVVVITDPDLCKQVMVKNFMKFHDRATPMFQPGGGRTEAAAFTDSGILFARGKFWAGIRAACEPLFHSKALESYAPLMHDQAAVLAERCIQSVQTNKQASQAETSAPDAPSDAVDMSGYLQAMTMDVIGTAAFGVHFGSQSNSDSRISRDAQFVMSPPRKPSYAFRFAVFAMPQLAAFWYYCAMALKLAFIQKAGAARNFIIGTSEVLLRNAKRHRAKIDGITADNAPQSHWHYTAWSLTDPLGVYKRDSQMLQKGREEAEAEYGSAEPGENSLLHRLLGATNRETGERMTDTQAGAQAFTFILAGSETTSVVLTFCIYELARNPEVQARLLEEIDAFGRDKAAGAEDLARFPYAEAVIKESMRKWPPVMPMLALQREAAEDVWLGSHLIPRGTRVWLNVLGMHRDPAHFPEPKVFKPERFLEGSQENASRHPFAYIPFGAGPRKCIGYRFAMQEAILVLVHLYQRLTFSLPPDKYPPGTDPELVSGITLNLKDGLHVIVHERR